MTSLGGNVSARTVECNNLEAGMIGAVRTSNKIEFLESNETRWSIGLDPSKNFVLKNEIADVKSIIADNNTGLCTILGSSGGGSLLSELDDVVTQDISHNTLLVYDDFSNNFKFRDSIHVKSIFADDYIQIDNVSNYYSDQTLNDTPLKMIKMNIGSPSIDFYPSIKINKIDSGYIELGETSQSYNNSIVLNATNSAVNATGESRFCVAPIRKRPNISEGEFHIDLEYNPSGYDNLLTYDASNEIQYATRPRLYDVHIYDLSANKIDCGDASFNNITANRFIGGDASLNDVDVSGNLKVTSDAYINNMLHTPYIVNSAGVSILKTTGSTFLNFNEGSITALDMFSSPAIEKDITLSKNVIVTGDLDVSGNASFYNNVEITNDLSVNHISCAKTNYINNSSRVAFQKNSLSGNANVHTLVSFKISNISTKWNFGHIHLHFVVQQDDFHTPYGGGTAHRMFSFYNALSGSVNKNLYMINADDNLDGRLDDVDFAVAYSSPDIINITYKNAINRVTSVGGVVEMIISNATITPC